MFAQRAAPRVGFLLSWPTHEDAVGAEAVRFSHGDFSLVVQALHDAAGKQLLSAEIVEDEFAMIALQTQNLDGQKVDLPGKPGTNGT